MGKGKRENRGKKEGESWESNGGEDNREHVCLVSFQRKRNKKEKRLTHLDEEDDDAVEHVPAQVHRLGHAHEEVEHQAQAVERDRRDAAPVLLRLAVVLAEVVALGDLRGEDRVGGHGGEHRADLLAELDVGVVGVGDVFLFLIL